MVFGPFEVDPEAVELRRAGVRIRIQKQPLQLLAVLLERPGQVVTRQELQKRLWPSDTFVDFEDGLNTAVKKLREALGDERERPQFIETIPRYGYRFISQVESAKLAHANGDHAAAGASAVENAAAPRVSSRTQGRQWLWILVGVVLTSAVGLTLWLAYGRPAFSFASHDSVLVADFENQTGEPQLDDALRAAFTVSLEQSRHFNVFPRARIGSVLQLMGKPADARITPALGREICQRENIRGLIACSLARTGNEYALSAELIDPQTGNTIRSYSQRIHGEDHILEALDRISAEARADLGESLYQIHQANRPLPEVTTPSVAALKDFAEGGSLWHQGRYVDAITHLRAAVDVDPNFAIAHAALGSAYFSYIENNQPVGQREYDKALALSGRTTERERLLIQANYADDLNHVEAADALYRLYLERYPGDWEVLSDYAHSLRTNGRPLDAIDQYKEILRIAPDDATTYIGMASAYLALGKLPEALGAYSNAFKLQPQWLTTGNINREYGFALVRNGEDEKAAQVFSALLADPKTRENGLRSLALLDLYHGRYASAHRRFQDSLLLVESANEPLSIARVHLWLGIVAEGQGDTREELRQLDAAAAQIKNLGPKVVFGAFVGLEYARANATAQAKGIENLIAPHVDPKNAEQAGYLHLLQGEIALAEGHAPQAIDLLTLADHDNDTPFSIEALAHAYQQSGAADKAIPLYEKLMSQPDRSLSWEPQQRWVAAHYTLAEDYLTRGERDKAKQELMTLLALWKDADTDLPLRKQALELRDRIS
jgi:DNA-binding winged helix-turn-helix (wHTH) protein/tetratricopeptide (TPR) repeat protein